MALIRKVGGEVNGDNTHIPEACFNIGCMQQTSVPLEIEKKKNTSQALAIMKSCTQPWTGVQGPPGIGKTEVEVAIAGLLFKIMKRYLENPNVGYTPGCEQCEYIRRHGSGRPGITHNETCRERVMARMAETEEGREIVEATEQRITRALADHVERHAQADPGPASAELPPAWPAAGCPVDENPFGSGQEAPVQREEPSDQAQGDEQSGTRHVEDPAPEDVDMDDQNPDISGGESLASGK